MPGQETCSSLHPPSNPLRSETNDTHRVILCGTRPGRRGAQVAGWVMEHANKRTDAEFELVDLADYPVPHLDEPLPPSMGQDQNRHTQDWAATIARFDKFVFVTPSTTTPRPAC